MTAAPPALLPGGRTLLAWWRDLAALRPRRLWFTHLLLHRLEALAEIAHPRRLDRLSLTLLHALTLSPAPGENGRSPSSVLGTLHLDPQLLGRLLRQLAGEGLIEPEAGAWALTARGRHALADGTFLILAPERRTFCFLYDPAGQPPRFLPLREAPTMPYTAGEDWRFDAALLEECTRRPAEWKARHGFPADVVGVRGVGPRAEPDWREVILDHPEQLRLAVVETAGEAGEAVFSGFAVKPEGWDLERAHPVLVLGEIVGEILPDLAEPAPDAWRQGWQHWCHPRGIPPAEADPCVLERVGHRLVVRAPKRLVDRLRAARSDALKHEAWLLAGEGRTRAAAEIEIIEAG